jgi:hypothetical protein
MAPGGLSGHNNFMKNNNFTNGKSTGTSPPFSNATLQQTQKHVGPSKDEIARKAYSIYQARGCPQGLDLQHWLEAETHVIGERNLSRIQN